MTDKRDIVLNELTKCDDDELPSFTPLNLGSYKLKTGVKYKDSKYDIDCAVRFNIEKIDEYNPSDLKRRVHELWEKRRTTKWKDKCITTIYQEEDKEIFHLDFPIYAYDGSQYHLAEGKRDECEWVRGEPEKLMDYLSVDGDEKLRKKYRRIVRFLKLWKSKVFSDKPNDSSPPSIGLTILVRDMANSGFGSSDDLDTLIAASENLEGIIRSSHVEMKLPHSPHNSDVFYKMNENSEFVGIFREEVQNLQDKLREARQTLNESLEEACKILRKLFPDFPMPDKQKAKQSFAESATYGRNE